MGASRSSLPASTSLSAATDVNVLVVEPPGYSDAVVALVPATMSIGPSADACTLPSLVVKAAVTDTLK